MACPVFALALSDQVAAYAVKCLTVVGAGLAGYVLGGLLVWGIDKSLLKQSTPAPLKKACQILLGLIAALVMAMIVFGEGGDGLFGGGGEGKGKAGSNDTDGKQTSPTNEKPKVEPVRPPAKTTDVKPGETIIHITVYGGNVAANERFYQIENDPTLKTFAELKQAILARKTSEPQGVAIAFQEPDDKNAVSADPRLMTQVSEWARREGIVVILAATGHQ